MPLNEKMNKGELRECCDFITARLRQWNPIGCEVPEEEYAGYAPQLVSMLFHGTSQESLNERLAHLSEEIIGRPSSQDETTAIANDLLRWWNSKSTK